MAIITIFSADFCKENELISELGEKTGFKITSVDQIVSEAATLSGMDKAKVKKALSFKTSVFERFTHEKKFALAYIKLVLSKMLMVSAGRDLILNGYATQLIPREITHFYRVGLISDMQSRVNAMMESEKISEKDAERTIRKLDTEQLQWLARYCELDDPFNPADYDLIIPMNKESVKDAADLIISHIDDDIFQPNAASRQAIKDFNLQATVEVALAAKGHNVIVHANCFKINILINKNVTRLGRLEKELRSIVSQVDGVDEIEIGVSKHFNKNDIYRKYDRSLPSRVLLVDDEQEFVETLSDRLALRKMGSAVAHDGESALKLIENDPPDVMVLDLKMHGVDGIEILKRVKKDNPSIEVIILTGHGSEEDKEKCMELGAFAYLRKPLDISELSAVLKDANEKVKKSAL